MPKLREEVVKQWLEGRSFKLPFVDIPILPSDISILGGLSICVATMFFLFFGRREHFAISHLLRDASESGDDKAKESVLHAVLSGLVFVTFTTQNEPHNSLKDVPDRPVVGGNLRWQSFLMIMFPAIALLLSIAADVYSYFGIDSPFRGYPPVQDWRENGTGFVFRKLLSLVFVAWAGHQCYSVVRFQRATGRLVAEFVKGCGGGTKTKQQ